MPIAVYGRLDELLRERDLTVDDLQREIERQFGLVVDAQAFNHLTGPDAVHHTDLAVVGAIALTLGVGLNVIFAVAACPVEIHPSLEAKILDETPVHQIRALLDHLSEPDFSEGQQHELDVKVYKRLALSSTAMKYLGNDPRRRRAFFEWLQRRRASTSR